MDIVSGAHDWSGTPLGSPDAWPAPLRVAAQLALESPHAAMVLWGGARLVVYNARCLAWLKSSHPRALGRSVREVTALAPLAARAEQVFASGHALELAALEVPDVGVLDGTCVPIRMDGAVAGVLLTATAAARSAGARPTWFDARFLSAIAHELRTPLGAMVLWARMLREGTLDEANRRRAIETLAQAADTQVRLVAELLDFARVSLGFEQLERVPVSLGASLAEAVASLRTTAAARRVTLELASAPTVEARLLVDPKRLQQVWTHLLTGAIGWAGEGGQVAIECRRQRDGLDVVVRSPGAGPRMPGAARLGWAMARQILTLEGGSLEPAAIEQAAPAELVVRFPSWVVVA